MVAPAVVWGGVWAVGHIGARLAARQLAKRIMLAAARRASSAAAMEAYRAAVTAGTLAPEDYIDLDSEYSDANDKADALAREMAAACAADPNKCEACEANRGTAVVRNWNMSARASSYQQFITGFTRNVEWNYNGVDFDGFWQPICTLVEAKDNYQRFLDVVTDDGGWFSDPSIERASWKEWFSGKEALVSEGRRQVAAARPSPPVELQWHCSQITVTMALAETFRVEQVAIVPQYTPHPTMTDPFSDFIR